MTNDNSAMASVAPASGVRMRYVIVLGVVTLASALPRFVGLSDWDFWYDECWTWFYVQHLFDWLAESNLLVESTNLPYYFLLKGWTALWGQSEAAFRSLSALSATLTVPILSALAWRLRGPVAAIVCGAIAALHPLHIYYAHEARAYALWMLLLSLTILLLMEAVHRNRWSWWIGFGISLLSCLHLHYFTLFLAPATVVALVLSSQRKSGFRRWFVTLFFVGLAFVPYFFAAVLPASRRGGVAWIQEYWDSLWSVPKSLWAFLPSGHYPSHLRGLSLDAADTVCIQPQWLVLIGNAGPAIIVALVISTLILRTMRRRSFGNHDTTDAAVRVLKGRKEPLASSTRSISSFRTELRRTQHLCLAGLTLFPLVLAWLYSLLFRPIYLVGRYDLVAWPAFMVWLAVLIDDATAICRSSPRKSPLCKFPTALAFAIIAPLLTCSIIPIQRLFTAPAGPSFHRARAMELSNRCGPGDLVIAFTYDRGYLIYYSWRYGFQGTIKSFPSWIDNQVGWVDTEADLRPENVPRLKEDAQTLLNRIVRHIDSGNHVWLLMDRNDPKETGRCAPVHAHLFAAMSQSNLSGRVTDADLYLLELKPADPPIGNE